MIAMSRVFRSCVENNYSTTSECFLNDKLVLTSAWRDQQQQRCKGTLWQRLGNTYRVSTVTCIGDLCGIVDDLVHNLLIYFITLQDPYSDTLVIGDEIEESDSATVSVITVCEESTLPATVCAAVSSTGEGSETVSLQSHSSQASIPDEEISLWVDEMEEQNSKRQKLNEAVHSISGGRYSPVMSSLNTTWDDVSDTQQRYYIRKAQETIVTSLSVITPGQEELVWKALQTEVLLDPNRDNQGKRKRFDPNSGLVDILVNAYEQAGHWQTKRQILSLFADDFSRAELQEMIPSLGFPNGASTKLANMQQKQGKASLSLKFLVSVQELSMKRWIISLNISPDQNLSRTWRSGQRLSSLTRGRKLSYQQSLGPSFLHASSDNI